MIYSWVVPKKNHTSPTEEISDVHGRRGESYKEFLELVQESIKGKGGLLISSMGSMDIFWNNPFCGNVRKNYCQGIKYHVFLT